MNDEIKEIKDNIRMLEYTNVNNLTHHNFEIEKLNKIVNDLVECNESIKKENKLLKEAIITISKHVGFKNDYINKLSNEIVKENFK